MGTTVQPDTETVTRRYVVDYLSAANRDIFVIEEGSYTQRFVYDEKGMRVTAEFDYAPNTRRGEGGENLQSDIAVELGKIWYKNSQIGTAVYAVDSDCKTVSHMIYDAWGEPQRGTYIDTNFSGIDALANFTGYTWDEVLELYFAQNRFYDPADRRFTQEDIVKDSHNWYAYCGNNPTLHVDPLGLAVLPYPGMIHWAVQMHIKMNHPSYFLEQRIDYEFGWGRADVISPDGQVWEVKSEGAIGSEGKLKKAHNQIDKYVKNKWHDNPKVGLKIGNSTIQGEFKLSTRYINYFVKYHCVGHGIIEYSYDYEIVSEQALEDMGMFMLIIGIGAILYYTGGAAILIFV